MNETAANPVVAELRKRIRRVEGGRAPRRAVLPFGIKEIGGRLPGGGLALSALGRRTRKVAARIDPVSRRRERRF